MNTDIEKIKQETAGSSVSAELVNNMSFIPEVVYQNLPEPLKGITNNFTGRERDIILLSSIGAISACLPKVFGIYDMKKYNTNLYLFIIAPPASGKGIMNWAKKLIDPIHEDIVRESRRKILEFNNSSDTDNIPKPKLKLKIMPGNVSSAKVYSHLEDADDGVVIFESEADSLSNMLKQDWGNFSDLLRKSFHHETISISRQTEDKYYDIKSPQLSIVVSGTPDQVRPLIQSKENGLFSRFIYYYFDEASRWKDVSPKANRINYDDFIDSSAIGIKNLYNQLKSLDSLEVKMSEEQWERFQDEHKEAENLIFNTNKIDFLGVTRRFGIITFRIVMIMAILRNKNNINATSNEIMASNEDLEVAINLYKVLVDHSLKVFDKYENKAIPMTMTERNLFSRLPQSFRRAIGLEIASGIGYAERTFDDVLKKWENKKLLKKLSHGNYEKFIEG